MLILAIPFPDREWAKSQAPGRVLFDSFDRTWYFRGASKAELPAALHKFYVGPKRVAQTQGVAVAIASPIPAFVAATAAVRIAAAAPPAPARAVAADVVPSLDSLQPGPPRPRQRQPAIATAVAVAVAIPVARVIAPPSVTRSPSVPPRPAVAVATPVARAAPVSAPSRPVIPMTVSEYVSPVSKFHVLCIPYTYQQFTAEHGTKWHSRYRVSYWQGVKARMPLMLTGFDCKPFAYESYIQDVLNESHAEVVLPSRSIVLRPDQNEAVLEISRTFRAGFPGFLLADEVGLGKTITSWATVLHYFKRPVRVAVVSPLSVHPGWRDTIKAMGNGGHTVVVLNYERLRNLYDEPTDTVEIAQQIGRSRALKRIANHGIPKPFDVYLWDESHYLKNLQSARSKLGVGLYRAGTHHIWLSATAGQSPLELGYLLPILQAKTNGIAELAPPTPKDFETWYKSADIHVSRGNYGKWVVGADPSEVREDCVRMAKILWEKDAKGVKIAMRRTPDDIAGWPSLQRIPWAVQLSPEEMKQYDIEWKTFVLAFYEEKKAAKVGETQGSAVLLRFRMKASLLRAKNTAAFAEELIESGQQVAISVQWDGTLNEIGRELEKLKIPYARITGKEVGEKREVERKRYQTGACPVVIFTVEAGINLHQGESGGNNVPRTQIVHDVRWSAIAMHQIDGRSQRDGKFAKTFWGFAEGTKEKDVATKLMDKLKSMKTMLGETDFKMEELEKVFVD